MPNLQESKKKIFGVKKTRQITKAMQLVAASKMKQFQTKALMSRAYSWDLLKFFKNTISPQMKSSYLEQREKGKTLFILYTSDKGLCGGLNTQLIKALLNSSLWKETPRDERLLMTIGKKSYEYCKYNELPVHHHLIGLPEDMKALNALEVISPILEWWGKKQLKQVMMVAPHYKNSFTFYPVLKTFLPFSEAMTQEHLGAETKHHDSAARKKTADPENFYLYYEPSAERVFEVMVEQIIQTLFLQSFYELKASEYSSRMIAMKNATDNADELLKQLNLSYNKARQAAITQQLAELSGALVV